jgi:hypothetical protein
MKGDPISTPSTVELPDALELGMNAVECPACEGSGHHSVGAFGAYYRDGYTYDSPGMVVCEDCAGSGRLEAAPVEPTLTDERILWHWNRRDECLHGSNAVIWFARAIEAALHAKSEGQPASDGAEAARQDGLEDCEPYMREPYRSHYAGRIDKAKEK